MRARLGMVGLLLAAVVACSALEATEPTAAPLPSSTPTTAQTTAVLVLMNGVTAGAPIPGESGRPLAQLFVPTNTPISIPTAAPTDTPRPTSTPMPTATPRGQTFPPLFPPDLATRPNVRWLPVPYRSQLNGNPYEESDCGPAAMGMILAAYGKDVSTMEVRRLVNRLQGTEGIHEAGTLIENLHVVAQRYGLKPNGLFAQKGLRRWTLDEVRARLEAGHPVIPQVWYRGLPGRETRAYNGDHYVVLTGYVGDEFIYNDPIDKDGPGYSRRITAAQLDKAWLNGDFPYAAVAVGGPPEKPSLRR